MADYLAYRRFLREHPDMCKSCGGLGGTYSRYDPSPAGISLSPGYMTDFDACPDCLDRGRCPLCGVVIQAVTQETEDGDYPETCPHCGWGLDFTPPDNRCGDPISCSKCGKTLSDESPVVEECKEDLGYDGFEDIGYYRKFRWLCSCGHEVVVCEDPYY